MGIKAVVFDFGQVISMPPDQKVLVELAHREGVEREKFEPLLWSLRGGYDRGDITGKAYFNTIFSRLGAAVPDDETLEELIELDFSAWKNINPGTTALMEDVKNAGYVLGILSNMPHEFLAWARKNVPVFSLSDVSLFSCEVGLIKPAREIYEKLLSMLGLEGRELVFFDDIAENVRSARALGMDAVLWKDPDCARRELESRGVRL